MQKPETRFTISILIVIFSILVADSQLIQISNGAAPPSWSTRGWAQSTTTGTHSYSDGNGGTIRYNVPSNYDRISWFRLPVSWCSIIGSPAAPTSNAPSTDTILLDRITRASNNILREQSGISLASGLQVPNYSVYHTFPKIVDFNVRPGIGVRGDVLDPVFDSASIAGSNGQGSHGGEYAGIFHSCDVEWGRDIRVGLSFINIGRFHNDGGAYSYVLPGNTGPSQTLGLTDCEFYANNLCLVGHFAVIDRSFMPDSREVVVAHETGHALSVGHRINTDGLPLMSPFVHLGSDRNFDNTILNTDEDRIMRITSNTVIGAIKDPPDKLVYTDTLGTAALADLNKNSSDYLDLSKVTVILNRTGNNLFIGNQIFGLFPNKTMENTPTFWSLIDADNDTKTGGSPEELKKITGVQQADLKGIDLLIKTVVTNLENVTDIVWQINDGKFVPLLKGDSNAYVYRATATPILLGSNVTSLSFKVAPMPIQDTVIVALNNKASNLQVDRAFNIQTIITTLNKKGNITVSDTLYHNAEGRGSGLILTNPKYPECFVTPNDALMGDNVKVDLNGFSNNSKIVGMLDSQKVFEGTTDSNGVGIIQFSIPQNTTEGFKQITSFANGSAISAICGLNVHTGSSVKQ